MTAGSSRFPDMELEVQKFWKADDTFKARLLLMACRIMATC